MLVSVALSQCSEWNKGLWLALSPTWLPRWLQDDSHKVIFLYFAHLFTIFLATPVYICACFAAPFHLEHVLLQGQQTLCERVVAYPTHTGQVRVKAARFERPYRCMLRALTLQLCQKAVSTDLGLNDGTLFLLVNDCFLGALYSVVLPISRLEPTEYPEEWACRSRNTRSLFIRESNNWNKKVLLPAEQITCNPKENLRFWYF